MSTWFGVLLVSPAFHTHTRAHPASVLFSDITWFSGFKFFELDELERLLRDAGFADVKASRPPSLTISFPFSPHQ